MAWGVSIGAFCFGRCDLVWSGSSSARNWSGLGSRAARTLRRCTRGETARRPLASRLMTSTCSRALACTIDSLAFDDDERGPAAAGLRVQLEALDRLNPDEQDHVRAYIEGALLRHQVRQVNVS